MKQSHPTVSIVIPTKNAGHEFSRLLSILRNQAHYSNAEIMIVDSGSSDETTAIARSFGCKCIEIEPHRFNHGGTRNLGISETHSEFVCLLTQDAFPLTTTFLTTLVQSILTENAAAGYARQIPRKQASLLVKRDVEQWLSGSPERRISEIQSPNIFFSLHPIHQYYACVFDDVASMIRRDVWKKIPYPIVAYGEDIEWGYRALVNGYTIVYEPRARVEHSHERSAEYAYLRTYIDHYRLYEIFGLRTIPTRRKMLRAVINKCMSDWFYLLRKGYPFGRDFQEFINVPRYAHATASGQFKGAKDAASGVPPNRSRDV